MLASSGACLESGSRAEIASYLVSFFPLFFLVLPYSSSLPPRRLQMTRRNEERNETHINPVQRD
jgi:hypothetical protein